MLPLFGFVLRALKQRRREQIESRLAAGEVWDDEWDARGLVFANPHGKPRDLRQDHIAWKALLDGSAPTSSTGYSAARTTRNA